MAYSLSHLHSGIYRIGQVQGCQHEWTDAGMYGKGSTRKHSNGSKKGPDIAIGRVVAATRDASRPPIGCHTGSNFKSHDPDWPLLDLSEFKSHTCDWSLWSGGIWIHASNWLYDLCKFESHAFDWSGIGLNYTWRIYLELLIVVPYSFLL